MKTWQKLEEQELSVFLRVCKSGEGFQEKQIVLMNRVGEQKKRFNVMLMNPISHPPL